MNSFKWHEEAEKQWDERANFWNQNSKEMWLNGSRKTIIPFITQHFEKESFVVDIGCGDGVGSFLLAQAGFHVTGVDLSKEMIERAEKNNQQVNLSFQQADILSLPFQDEEIDGMMAINSLEWTEVPAHALKEATRIVKSGGYACVGILGPTAGPRANSYRRLYGEDVICNTMMPWEFEKLANEQGWSVIDGHGVYKKGVNEQQLGGLSTELKQSLTFMWVFLLRKS
ncbi:class I SAM-dependent methyltransferase [Metabacillus iocasae]|uniref:Ubiquinone/menaquinone biosynthesis C-methylase UbiE n=1 Tax=Priestia iocasae TaxID=2291674 RepID=A0ABS2QUP8_9BACI|nr:class I SAM-dependent methyltransferase [Metabacillus iocasae]MBM7703224.1 ubiquinone/menaquinone biosynthesis C-methylase UbiE [Metabacillus iocasae]